MQKAHEKEGPLGPHHDEAAWLEARKSSLGASEVAVILGHDVYGITELDVYLEKTGASEGLKETRFMKRGKVLEAPAADLYEEETGRKLRRMPLVRHKELPLHATLDRQILAGQDLTGGEHPTAGLEIKVPAWRTYAKVLKEGILPHWLIQAHVQHMVTGYPFIGFGILNADAFKMLTHDYLPIEGLTSRIEDRVGEWWEAHIVKGVAPTPKIEAPVELPQVPADRELAIFEDEDWKKAVRMYLDARDVLEAAKELDSTAREELKKIMRDREVEVAEGFGLRAYSRMRPGRKSFQKKELAAVKPVDPRALKMHMVQIEGWPLSQVEGVIAETLLDLSEFEKEGRPFAEFRPYVLKGEEHE